MTRYARSFLRSFLAHFLWVFVVLQAFFGLALTVATLTGHPYVPLTAIVSGFPDAVLALLPFSLPFSVLVASLFFVKDIRAHGGFLSVQLAGRDPRLLLWPLLAIGLVFALGLGLLELSVLPMARWQTSHGVKTTAATTDALAVRLARKPHLLDGFAASFGAVRDGVLHDFVMTSLGEAKRPTAVTARTAELVLADEGRSLQVRLRDGRYLGLDADRAGLGRNLRFEHLRLDVPTEGLGVPSKRELVGLKYYTDAELDRLPDQVVHLMRSGKVPPRRVQRRVAGVWSIRVLRWQSAGLSFLFLALVVAYLGVHGEGRGRQVRISAFCLLLLLQQVLLQARVEKNGPLAPGWIVLLPTIEAAVALALAPWLLRRGEGRARVAG